MYLKADLIRQRRFPIMVIALFVLGVFACAKQGFPPGGPVDDISPELKSSSPAINSVNVPLNSDVTVEFSEPMEEKSVEDNIFIVPIPLKWPEFEWGSGSRQLTIKMSEPLKENTTYILTIGAKSQDRHRNGLKNSIMLSFSTGAVVENKRIKGKVIPYSLFDEKPEKISEVDVIAYRLEADKPEPDPSNDIPAYFTQTGLDGTYEMAGLSNGNYRVFAIGDNDRDGFYTPDSDLIGVMPHDVVISEKDTVFFAPDIMVSIKQKPEISLITVRAIDQRRIELPFDRPVNTDSLKIQIEGLDIQGWFQDPKNPRIISVATGVQEAKKRYGIDSLYVVDDNGYFSIIKPENTFAGSDKPDTTSLEIVEWGPKILIKPDEEISLKFNRVLDIESDVTGIIKQENGGDVIVSKRKANELVLTPDGKWQRGFNYIINFDTENLKGISGNMLAEEKSQIIFRAAPEDSFSSVGGIIEDITPNDKSFYRIVYKNLETGYIYSLNISEPGAWQSNDFLPGSYLFLAHKDKNGDGRIFPGAHYPFSPSEQVYALEDTVKVALRWQIDNINFIFR